MNKAKRYFQKLVKASWLWLGQHVTWRAFKSLISGRAVLLTSVLALSILGTKAVSDDLVTHFHLTNAGQVRLVVNYTTDQYGQIVGITASDRARLKRHFASKIAQVTAVAQKATHATRGKVAATSLRFKVTEVTPKTVLRLHMVAGKSLTVSQQRSSDQVAVISRGLARQVFATAHQAVGQAVTYNGRSYRIIGVSASSKRRVWVARRASLHNSNHTTTPQAIVTLKTTAAATTTMRQIRAFLTQQGTHREEGTYHVTVPQNSGVAAHVVRALYHLTEVLAVVLWLFVTILLYLHTKRLLQAIAGRHRKQFQIALSLATQVTLVNLIGSWVIGLVAAHLLLGEKLTTLAAPATWLPLGAWMLSSWLVVVVLLLTFVKISNTKN